MSRTIVRHMDTIHAFATRIMTLLDTAHQAPESDRDTAKQWVLLARTELQDQIARHTASSELEHGCGRLAGWQAKRVLMFIDEHLADPVRLDELSAVAGLSKPYFCRAFKRTFGKSPHAYIMHCRVEHSSRLMLGSTATLTDIALCCGFSDQPHFSRVFRRLIGQTPAVWRRHNRSFIRN